MSEFRVEGVSGFGPGFCPNSDLVCDLELQKGPWRLSAVLNLSSVSMLIIMHNKASLL